jgi:hypothetical protein
MRQRWKIASCIAFTAKLGQRHAEWKNRTNRGEKAGRTASQNLFFFLQVYRIAADAAARPAARRLSLKRPPIRCKSMSENG